MKQWITTEEFIKWKPYDIFAEGVGYESPSDSGLENIHTLFRKEFELSEVEGKTWTLKITADDSYKVYVNGILCGIGPAGSYHSRFNYNCYDITAYLKPGKNVIAAHVYYHGKITYSYVSMDNRQGLWINLFDGENCVLATDQTWNYHVDKSYVPGEKTWGYDTQFAENINRPLHPRGWNTVGFDDSTWQAAVEHPQDDHVLVEQITPSVEFYEVHPKSVTQMEEGQVLLDFGKELVGYVRMKVNSPSGGCVRICCGEELWENGHVRFDMRCGVHFDETWTYDAGEDLIESFDYSGFRYLEYMTEDPSIKPEAFSVLVRHYPIGENRGFACEDPLLQKIWDICANGVTMGVQEGYYDCPTREKGQYLGDMLITALSHYYISGDLRIYKKGLLDFAESMSVYPGMAAVSPGAMPNPIVDYSLLFPLIVKNYGRLSGDNALVQELLPVMDEVIAYYGQYKRADGLLDCVKEWNLVDWPHELRDDYEFELTRITKPGVHNVVNAYYYGAMKTVNELKEHYGIPGRYDTQAFRETFFRAFYCKETGFFTDCEHGTHSALHSNVIPYFYDMTTEEQNARMPKFIMEKGLSCGVYFSYFVLKSLTRHGEKEKAMELILGKGAHSWYQMISEDATACFEAWGKEQKSNTSLCHPWASSPIILLREDFPELDRSAARK